MCNYSKCTLPQHHDNEPVSYEIRPTWNRGPNPPRKPDRHAPYYADPMFRIKNVSDFVLAVHSEDILCDVETPNTYSQATNSR